MTTDSATMTAAVTLAALACALWLAFHAASCCLQPAQPRGPARLEEEAFAEETVRVSQSKYSIRIECVRIVVQSLITTNAVAVRTKDKNKINNHVEFTKALLARINDILKRAGLASPTGPVTTSATGVFHTWKARIKRALPTVFTNRTWTRSAVNWDKLKANLGEVHPGIAASDALAPYLVELLNDPGVYAARMAEAKGNYNTGLNVLKALSKATLSKVLPAVLGGGGTPGTLVELAPVKLPTSDTKVRLRSLATGKPRCVYRADNFATVQALVGERCTNDDLHTPWMLKQQDDAGTKFQINMNNNGSYCLTVRDGTNGTVEPCNLQSAGQVFTAKKIMGLGEDKYQIALDGTNNTCIEDRKNVLWAKPCTSDPNRIMNQAFRVEVY
jgi:hypothetical protein